MRRIFIQIAIHREQSFDIRPFNRMSGIIAATYELNLDFRHKGLHKITIDLNTGNLEEMGAWDYTDAEGVFVLFRHFDFNNHFEKNFNERKLEILDTLQDSMMIMCKRYNFDRQPFVDAYNAVIEKNLEHKELYNRLTLNKNRKNKAAIEINMNEAGASINVLFTDKNGTPTLRNEVFRTQPHYMFVQQIAKSGKWIDNEHYAIFSPQGVVSWVASLNNNTVETIINSPNKEKVQAKLKELYYSEYQ